MTHTSASTQVEVSQKFSDLDIPADLKRGVKELGYSTPTVFQLDILESFQGGNSIILGGQSNYGKSLAYSLPILSKIDSEQKELQTLIVCESSLQAELAAKEYRALGRYLNVDVATSVEESDKKPSQIIILSADDFLKTDLSKFSSLKTIFFDSLSEANFTKALSPITSSLEHLQLLIFSQEPIASLKAHAGALLDNAVFINNNDQPRIAMPAKHIFHKPKEAEPKPRALLATLELHKPKFAVVTCKDNQECDLLARYLARYGYRVRVVSEDADEKSVGLLINEGIAGNFSALICNFSALFDQNLENVPFMVNYDMFDRPQNYEQATQFAKQAPGLQRTIVNLLSSRELGYLGPIKAQCLIDFVEEPLPSDDDVIDLCVQRIIDGLHREAEDVELGQFEALTQKILAHEKALPAMSFLLRNHLITDVPRTRTDEREHRDSRRHSRSPQNDRKRPDRRDGHRDRDRDRPRAFEGEEREPRPAPNATAEGITRLYITLGKRDGFSDLASLAQYISDKSTVDLGHFSGSGMVRDSSAHIEVDDDVANNIIEALNDSPRPNQEAAGGGEEPNLVVCEKARAAAPRFRRGGPQPRRRQNYPRRQER